MKFVVKRFVLFEDFVAFGKIEEIVLLHVVDEFARIVRLAVLREQFERVSLRPVVSERNVETNQGRFDQTLRLGEELHDADGERLLDRRVRLRDVVHEGKRLAQKVVELAQYAEIFRFQLVVHAALPEVDF